MKVSTDGVLLGACVNPKDYNNILDIGAGTGLIAIMMAQKSEARIDAVEIEPDAYRQAVENVDKCPWANRIKVIHSAFQDYSKFSANKYDLIVSNPPFFSNSLKTPFDKRNLARHNDILPPEALLEGVNRLLSEHGRFCVILPYIDSSLFVVDAAIFNLYCIRKILIKPTFQKKTTRVIMEFSRQRSKIQESELVIKTGDGNYTEEYASITKDYYLFF